jgi:heme exporter protein B
MLKALSYIFYTEWLLQLRRSQDWLYPLGFFLIIMSFFPLAFTPDPAFLKKYITGCVWIAALLASLLSIENIFFSDLEDGCLEQQLLNPMPLAFITLIKIFAKWLCTELPLILLIPFIGLMFNLSWMTILVLVLSLLLGTPILVLLGSLGAALTFGLKQPGVLLGFLILPLTAPVLIFGVSLVQQAERALSIVGPLAFLAGLSLLAITLLPLAIAATLRIGVDD